MRLRQSLYKNEFRHCKYVRPFVVIIAKERSERKGSENKKDKVQIHRSIKPSGKAMDSLLGVENNLTARPRGLTLASYESGSRAAGGCKVPNP